MMARPAGKPRAMADIREAITMYKANVKVADIAEKFGVTQPTISYWVRRHGSSIGGKSFKVRKQGRRKNDAPCARDAEIMQMAGMGVPQVVLARILAVTRSRVSYIVKTWTKRGFQPEVPFAVGQTVKRGDGHYVILEVYGLEGGRVLQTHGLVDGQLAKLKIQQEIVDFTWYKDGLLSEVVDDATPS